jgi:hypothetical protein
MHLIFNFNLFEKVEPKKTNINLSKTKTIIIVLLKIKK